MNFSVLKSVFAFQVLCTLCGNALADLQIGSYGSEDIQIRVSKSNGDEICSSAIESLYATIAAMRRGPEGTYLQRLNSEIDESAAYLKAAKQGQGIYVYLPAFVPTGGDCEKSKITVRAKHILWNGVWYSDHVMLLGRDLGGRAIFFSEEDLVVDGSIYIDPKISPQTRSRLYSAFRKIAETYEKQFKSNPLNNVGVIASLVFNGGKYSGFGGDATNIIRLSFDNPSSEDLLSLDSQFYGTFAHEIAHKLQSESLFDLKFARFTTEGGADFLKVVLLYNSSTLDEVAAKAVVEKAISSCLNALKGELGFAEMIQQNRLNYRVPYDCGMAYYFAAYFEAPQPDDRFFDDLLSAFSGAPTDSINNPCLRFGETCRSQRLSEIATGERSAFIRQLSWLRMELQKRGIPRLAR